MIYKIHSFLEFDLQNLGYSLPIAKPYFATWTYGNLVRYLFNIKIPVRQKWLHLVE